ncbi:ADP-ribose glycohydrolase oard1, partial [Thoreauomyces humboldtii]
METLRAALVAMRDECVQRGVRVVAMPRIGCGLDGLRWGDVREMLSDVFGQTDVHVDVYY